MSTSGAYGGPRRDRLAPAPRPPGDQATPLLIRAIRALGQPAPDELADACAEELLQWSARHWDASLIPRTRNLAESQLR